jgi:peptidoglycan/xylan/chitin deacetylase (PgdA/CDA1 family)
VIQTAAKSAFVWGPLLRELDNWAAAGRTAHLWLRDDDATEVTPALERLAKLCEAYGVPCLVAVIPAEAKEELGDYFGMKALFEVAAHGFSHKNYAPTGAKKQEFPEHRDRDQIERELAQGRRRLQDLLGQMVADIFVPPWNRIGADVASRLPTLGFRALSALGRKPLFQCPAPLIEINAHLDIIDWRGKRGGHDPAWLAANLAEQLARARANGGEAVGVLTHHLVHDAPAWRFLEELFARTASHPSVRWTRASDIIREQEAMRR